MDELMDNMPKGVVGCDLLNAVRKFSNKDIALVAQAIYSKGPMTLGELRTETGLSTNTLNHSLIDMRNVSIVKKIEKKYYLTKFGAVLIEALDRIKGTLSCVPEDAMFSPIADGDTSLSN